MFNSQKINSDPKPWVRRWLDGRETRHEKSPALLGTATWSYRPRPKYDNNPNPILVAVRYVSEKHGMAPEETVNLANLWLRKPRYYESNLAVKSTKSHKAHAYKVLTRLVNIFGTED